ncbi:MAG: hypothetical protein WCT30_00910, partial [Desulfurivibrionaceae bacterium]
MTDTRFFRATCLPLTGLIEQREGERKKDGWRNKKAESPSTAQAFRFKKSDQDTTPSACSLTQQTEGIKHGKRSMLLALGRGAGQLIVPFHPNMTGGATGIGGKSHLPVMAGATVFPFIQGIHGEIGILLGSARSHLKNTVMTAVTGKA